MDRKDVLICVDSDGCVMDAMEPKHRLCFGPCLVDQWQLGPWRERVLARWNQLNLHTLHRGVNRFRGLALALTEIDRDLVPIPGVEEYASWTETAPTLSNDAVAAKAWRGGCFAKALAWSQAVNRAIAALPPETIQPFPGAPAGLAAAHNAATVAVVSGANREALTAEWTRYDLLRRTDEIFAQDAGTKERCLQTLLARGFSSARALMVGDAPGDLEAARRCGVAFYPILPDHEAASWREFREIALPRLLAGQYEDYGARQTAHFLEVLGGKS
jgi:phosphoglycolate phosphatase-like HAD superfamily hydrolase